MAFDKSKFELSKKINQLFVDGILSGYSDYLDVRREKKENMRISGAYAWVRGNHIDNQVSEFIDKAGMEYYRDKAGYTWEYFKFSINVDGEKCLVLVKNSNVSEKIVKQSRNDESGYLVDFARFINKKTFEDYEFEIDPLQLVLELKPGEKTIEEQAKAFQMEENFSRFYIVTYTIDDSKQIVSINLTMPYSGRKSGLIQIQDLTPLIRESEYEITPEDLEVIRGESGDEDVLYSGDANGYGFEKAQNDEKHEES